MKTTLVITDLTRMSGTRVCLAGYTKQGDCVRPELPYGQFTEDWLFRDGRAVVRPFAAIEVDLDRHIPHPPHTEDWLVRPGPAVARGQVAPGDRQKFLDRITDPDLNGIFGTRVHQENGWWVEAGQGTRSLGTVKARLWEVFHRAKDGGGWDYRLVFTDASGQRYRLAVTDLAFRYFVDYKRQVDEVSGVGPADAVSRALKGTEVYLRLGLARNWPKFPERCYLQVNGIYSFPDYLGGKCFSDFATVPGSRITAATSWATDSELEDLPF